jgi:hypothetical protein
MATTLLRCYNTWWIVCLSSYFAKLFLATTSLLSKQNIQHFCFHNHVLQPMSAHVCYATLLASTWRPHVLAIPISVVHVLVVVAHFDVVVVHFASVSSVDEEFRFHWELCSTSVVRKDGIDLDLPTKSEFVVFFANWLFKPKLPFTHVNHEIEVISAIRLVGLCI